MMKMGLIFFLTLLALSKGQFNFPASPLNVGPRPSNIPGTGIIKDAVQTAGQAANAVLDAAFGDFKSKFNKNYGSLEEELKAKQNYIANRAKVLAFNDGSGLPSTFIQKLNGFADMVSEQFNKAFNGFGKQGKAEKPTGKGEEFKPPATTIPTEVDWTKKGGVTPVKSQKLCAGCWAFAAAGALEGQNFRKTGKLVEVSPQHLIDCTSKYGNNGCTGGLTNPAYEYIKENKGVNSLSGYPFEAKNGQCRYKKENDVVSDKGFAFIDEGSEKHLEAAVATLGPVSAAMDAGNESFQFYSEGVYYEPKCQNSVDKLNHAVLVVGYGVEPDGKKYWLVKNSYGPDWGIGGYFKLAKDKGNHCGIATYASYPLV